MANIELTVGVKFKPSDIKTKELQDTIKKAIARTKVEITKISISNKVINDAFKSKTIKLTANNFKITQDLGKKVANVIKRGLRASKFNIIIDKASLSAQIKEAIKSINAKVNISRTARVAKPAVGSTRFAPAAGTPLGAKEIIDSKAAKRAIEIKTNIDQAIGAIKKLKAESTEFGRRFAASVKETAKLNTSVAKLRELSSVLKSIGIPRQNITSLKQLGTEAISTERSFRALLAIVNSQRKAQGQSTLSIQQGRRELGAFVRENNLFAQSTTRATSGIKSQVAALARVKVGAARAKEELKKLTAANRPQRGAARANPLIAGFRQGLTDLKGFNREVTASEKAQFNFQKLLQQGGTSAQFFGAKIAQVTTRFAAYLVSIRAIFLAQQAFNKSLRAIVNFDNIIQDLQKVLQNLPGTLREASSGIFEIAQATGRGVDEIAISLNNFIRQGISLEEALERTNAALIAVNITELTADQSTKLITSSLKIFGDEVTNATEVLDILSVTSDNAATTAGQVGQAFLRSASSAKAAGVGFRELLAITAASIEQTQATGQRLGTALKTIFTRVISNADALRKQANAFGANIRPGAAVTEVLEQLSKIFPALNKEQRVQLGLIVAGRRQFDLFAGIVNSFNKSLELQEKQFGSAGTAARKNEVELAKLSSQARILGTNLVELVNALAGTGEGAEGAGSIRDVFVGILTTINTTVESVTEFTSFINSAEAAGVKLSSVFKGLAKVGFFATAGVILRGIISGFSQFAKIGTVVRGVLITIGSSLGTISFQTNKLVTSEVQVNTELQKQANIRQRILGIRKQEQQITGQQAAGARGGGLAGAGRNIAILSAFAIGMQAVTDNLVRVANELEETEEAADQQNAAFIKAGASALNMAVLFGLLGGPITGVIAGLGTLAIGIFNFVSDIRKAEDAAADLAREANRGFTQEELLGGGDLLQDAILVTEKRLKELEKTTGNTEQQIRAIDNPLSQLEIAFDLAQKKGTGLAKLFDTTSVSIQALKGTIDRVTAAAKIAGQLQENQIRGAQRVRRIELGIEIPGEVTKEVKEIINSLADAQVLAETFAKRVGDTPVERFALVSQAVEALANQNSSIKEVFEAFNLGDDILKGLVDKEKEIGEEIKQQKKLIEEQLKPTKDLLDITKARSDGIAEEIKNIDLLKVKQQGNLNVLRQAERLTKTKIGLIKLEKAIQSNVNQLTSEQTRLVATITSTREKQAKEFIKIRQNVEAITSKIKENILTTQAESKQLVIQTNQLETQLDVNNKLFIVRKSSSSVLRDLESSEERIRANIEAQLSVLEKRQQASLQFLKIQREEIDEAKNLAEALKLDEEINKLGTSFEQQLKDVRGKLELEAEIKIREESFQKLQSLERALADFRGKQIQQTADAEQRVSERRINIIRQFGNSRAFARVFQNQLRALPQFAKRTFGSINALVLREQTKIAESSVKALLDEFEIFSKSGVDDLEKLQRAQEIQGEIALTTEDLVGKRREAILKKVEEVTKKVGIAEEQLVSERNKIPGLNAKVIEAQRDAAGAAVEIQKATEGLFDAFQAAADAQARLRFDVLSAAFDIRKETGAIASVGDQVRGLAEIFRETNAQIRVSEEAGLEFRKQIADEQLQIFRNQFNSIKNIGLQAATASLESLTQLQQGLATAAQIATTGTVQGLNAEDLAEALNFKDLFPQIERSIAEAGLERLGIDPGILESVEENMVRLAEISAETGIQQVNAAFEQVGVAREQLDEARENKKQTDEELQLSIEQRNLQLRRVAQAAGQLGLARSRLKQASTNAGAALSRLSSIDLLSQDIADSNLAISTKMDTLISEIQANTQQLQANQNSLASVSSLLSDLGGQLGGAFGDIGGFIGDLVGNSAGGTLSNGEIGGLVAAAKREKRAMPPGSDLMLANTSEVVLTRRQSQLLGLTGKAQSFAADGNVDSAALQSQTVALTNAINSLIGRLSSPGFIEQNINVNFDNDRTINVRGMGAIDEAIRRGFQQEMQGIATKDEQTAISNVIESIVGRLFELGIVDTRGA